MEQRVAKVMAGAAKNFGAQVKWACIKVYVDQFIGMPKVLVPSK